MLSCAAGAGAGARRAPAAVIAAHPPGRRQSLPKVQQRGGDAEEWGDAGQAWGCVGLWDACFINIGDSVAHTLTALRVCNSRNHQLHGGGLE